MSGANRGAGLVVLAAVCFATLGSASRFAFAAGVDPLTLVTWRAVIGLVFVLVISLVLARMGQFSARPLGAIPRRELVLNAIAGLVNALLNLAALLAITRIGVTLTLLVFYTYPAMIALVSTLFFGDRLDGPRWIALGVSLLGLVLVIVGAGSIGQIDLVGVALAFLGGVCQVGYALLARHGFPAIPAPQAAAGTFLVAAVFYLVAGLGVGNLAALGSPLSSPEALLPVLWAGTIGAGIPTMAWIMGIRALGAPRAAIISTLEPVVGVMLAAVLLGERPTPIQVAGGALIVAAAIVVQRRASLEASDHEAVPDPELVP